MKKENRSTRVSTAFTSLMPLSAVGLLLCLVVAAGCSSTSTDEGGTRAATPSRRQGENPLRVAIAADYPPLIFQQGDSYAGFEVDMARALGRELKRPIDFILYKRNDLVSALQDGRADIVMSGMSVTKARSLRAAFAEPYLRNQLRAIFRRTDAERYQTAADITLSTARIGFLPGTTADVFVQNNCPDATRVPVQNRRDTAFWLTDAGQLDLFIDDGFALAQIISENEAKLVCLQFPLAEEELAWAVAPNNTELLRQVNALLNKWKADGTLQNAVQRWMPYLKRN